VGIRRFLPVSFVMLGSALANILLNMWLIPLHGAVGAAWASTATYFGVAAGELALFLKYSGYSFARFCRECRFAREDFTLYAAFLKNLRFWRG
jgi:O-antigen/teichoic acid export membrane protein